MNPRGNDHAAGKMAWRLLFALLSATLVDLSARAQGSAHEALQPPFLWPLLYMSSPASDTRPENTALEVPGTILPVRLNTSLSSLKSKPRQHQEMFAIAAY
jgi:hypothetical protein